MCNRFGPGQAYGPVDRPVVTRAQWHAVYSAGYGAGVVYHGYWAQGPTDRVR